MADSCELSSSTMQPSSSIRLLTHGGLSLIQQLTHHEIHHFFPSLHSVKATTISTTLSKRITEMATNGTTGIHQSGGLRLHLGSE